MKNLTLKNIAAACGGVYHGDAAPGANAWIVLRQTAGMQKPGCLFCSNSRRTGRRTRLYRAGHGKGGIVHSF